MLRPDPVPELKRQLAAELVRALRGWSPGDVWYRLKLDHARLWELRHARLDRFSLQRLVRLLVEADKNVTVTVTVRGRS